MNPSKQLEDCGQGPWLDNPWLDNPWLDKGGPNSGVGAALQTG